MFETCVILPTIIVCVGVAYLYLKRQKEPIEILEQIIEEKKPVVYNEVDIKPSISWKIVDMTATFSEEDRWVVSKEIRRTGWEYSFKDTKTSCEFIITVVNISDGTPLFSGDIFHGDEAMYIAKEWDRVSFQLEEMKAQKKKQQLLERYTKDNCNE